MVRFDFKTKSCTTVPSCEEVVTNGKTVVVVTGEVVVVSNHGNVPSPFMPSAICKLHANTLSQETKFFWL